MFRLATPVAFRAAAPREVVPEKKFTVPVGVPLVLATTVSVRVT